MKEHTLSYIADYQLLHGGFCRDLSLMRGKAGIAVFFFLYARHTRNDWYEEFAAALLQDISEQLSIHTPVTFAGGLCGIGWSIEFLSQHGFIENDTDELLTEIDSKITEYDPVRLSDRSFENGLEGVAAYVQSRLEHRPKTVPLPFDPDYLARLEKAVQKQYRTDRHLYTIDRTWKQTLGCFSRQTIRDNENWKKGLILLHPDTP